MASITCNMISYTLKRTVDIKVILPTVTIPEALQGEPVHHHYPKKYPVVYLLHGYGNNHQQWTSYTNVELYAEENSIAIVMIAGENKAYINKGDDLFEDFIEKELKEFITNTFPISSLPEKSYIAGLSMGGFGALYHGIKYPDKYCAIGAFSPALTMAGIDQYDILAITKKQHKDNQKLPDLYISCGDQDFLYQNIVDYVTEVKKMDIPLTWVSEPDFSHEWRFWDLAISRFLNWIKRSDGYVNKKRKV